LTIFFHYLAAQGCGFERQFVPLSSCFACSLKKKFFCKFGCGLLVSDKRGLRGVLPVWRPSEHPHPKTSPCQNHLRTLPITLSPTPT
jgi:hypothetical protein